MDWLSTLLIAFTALFVVVEPIGVVPIFASLSRGKTAAQTSRTALRASVAGALVLILFVALGDVLLAALAIRLDAFRAAGGLLLLLTALDMLRAKQLACRCSPAELQDAASREDIAIVPLAIPLLSGPGAMATVMVLMAGDQGAGRTAAVVAAIVAVFALSYVILRAAPWIQRTLGESAMSAMQRVFGLILAAMSTQLILTGGAQLLRSALS